jgi:AGZA family xanthine/uracil permease-like MFS transporter
VSIYTGQLLAAGARPDPSLAAQCETLAVLGRGFILTALLWGAACSFLIDGRARAILATFAVLAGFALFGVIHSVDPAGGLYLPGAEARPIELAVAYGGTGVLLAGLTAWRRRAPVA